MDLNEYFQATRIQHWLYTMSYSKKTLMLFILNAIVQQQNEPSFSFKPQENEEQQQLTVYK